MPELHPDRPERHARRFAPLRLVAAELRASAIPADTFFDPDDFMLVSWAMPDCPAHIKAFKHVDTRRYLYLDADGAPYRRDHDGTYVRHATLRDAIDALGFTDAGLDQAS